jgi:hypothetical protein
MEPALTCERTPRNARDADKLGMSGKADGERAPPASYPCVRSNLRYTGAMIGLVPTLGSLGRRRSGWRMGE